MSASPFDYVTYKYVVLKDRRLGVAYYILAFFILIFTVTEVFVRKGYLQIDTNLQGTVRAIVSEELSGEIRDDDDDPSQIHYCKNVSCKYQDPLELNWPVEGRAVTITTFAKEKYQRTPPQNNPQSEEYEIVKYLNYFTMGPEYVVIKVDHAVVASLFTDSKGNEMLAESKRTMRGYLVNQNGKITRELTAPGKADKITLKELLETAGIESLDTRSSSPNAKGQNVRQRGAVLRVSINYQNWYDTWFGTRVRYIPYMDYNCKQIIPYHPYPDQNADTDYEIDRRRKKISDKTQWRILRKRYAVRVEFEQRGSLGMFSFSTLLLKLASGMGLLALAATVIDTFALYLLPNKNKYREYVYEPSAVITKEKGN